jgi:hypothetical protein
MTHCSKIYWSQISPQPPHVSLTRMCQYPQFPCLTGVSWWCMVQGFFFFFKPQPLNPKPNTCSCCLRAPRGCAPGARVHLQCWDCTLQDPLQTRLWCVYAIILAISSHLRFTLHTSHLSCLPLPRCLQTSQGLHKPAQQTVLPAQAVPSLLAPLPLSRLRSLGGKLGEENGLGWVL